MLQQWYEPLPETERDKMLSKIANVILKKKLEAPAILFLESHRPLSYIGSQASLVFSPFLIPFLGLDNVRDFSRLLQEPANVERLINRLEDGKIEKELEPEVETKTDSVNEGTEC